MLSGLSIAAPLLLRLVFLLLASCSKRPYVSEDLELLELTEQSLHSFTGILTSSSNDALASKLRGDSVLIGFCQQSCLKYLIGSVAVFGKVDEHALGVLCELGNSEKILPLSGLVDELVERNDHNTVVQFLARNVGHSIVIPLRNLLIDLIERDWNAVKELVPSVLAVLKEDVVKCQGCHPLVRSLSVEQQYEMLRTGTIPLEAIGSIYLAEEPDLLLRGVFAWARYSYNPSPQIRNYIADQQPYFRQFLADEVGDGTASPCPENIPVLNNDLWSRIFTFLDIETLVFVLPAVCAFWRKWYPRILAQDTRIHDLYCQGLNHFGPFELYRVAPWKCCLLNRANALDYLGRCIMGGVLRRIKLGHILKLRIIEYANGIMCGDIPLPKNENHISQYESFLKLLEEVYESCAGTEQVLGKPPFLTNEEYEHALHYFLCQKELNLRLSAPFTFDSMTRLFCLLEENEELMKRLVFGHFSDFLVPSIILIVNGHKGEHVPERLARLFFSQTVAFKGLVEPRLVCPNQYYNFIFEFNLFPEMLVDRFLDDRFWQLATSFLLFLKDDAAKINKFMGSVADRLSGLATLSQYVIASQFQSRMLKALADSNDYPSEDAGFIREIAAKFTTMALDIARKSQFVV